MMNDLVEELSRCICLVKDEAANCMIHKSHIDIEAMGAIKACNYIANKLDELHGKYRVNNTIDRIVEYIEKTRLEAIRNQRHYSIVRNYSGLSRANEVENTCDNILNEIRKILEEQHDSI